MVLERYQEGAFELGISPWIVGEVERALSRPGTMSRYMYEPADVREFLDGLQQAAEIFVDPTEVRAVVRDPSDDQVVAAAVAAGADYLITSDQDMLVLKEHEGIKIVSPREFLGILAGRDEAA